MIELSLTGFFVLYIVVFLAIIFASWLIFSWRRQLSIHRSLRRLTCKFCGASISRDQSLAWVRCPECGARNQLVSPVPKISSSPPSETPPP